MRLIDADAMLKRNEHSIYDTTDLKEMLDNEPTVELKEIEEFLMSEYCKEYFDSLVRVEDMNLSDMSCFTIGENKTTKS